MADKKLRATQAQFVRCAGRLHRLQTLSTAAAEDVPEELQLIDQHMSQLDQELASLLSRHQDAVSTWQRCLV